MRVFCLLGWHSRVLLDYSQCVQPLPNVIVGKVIRRCARCGKRLPGDEPRVMDRARPDDLPRLMTPTETIAYDLTGYVPDDFYGRSW